MCCVLLRRWNWPVVSKTRAADPRTPGGRRSPEPDVADEQTSGAALVRWPLLLLHCCLHESKCCLGRMHRGASMDSWPSGPGPTARKCFVHSVDEILSRKQTK